MILGINASRARSGGARAHLMGILTECDPEKHKFTEVHVWSYRELLDALPKSPWIIKHCPSDLELSMFRQLWWERFSLPKLLHQFGCDVLLNVDAGTVCRYHPAVTMSRDMLSYEPGEMKRFGWGKARLRLILLRYLQNSSLKAADGAIFLTRYAANVIQKFCGTLARVAIVPHGVGDVFFLKSAERKPWPNDSSPFRCLYVSNVAPYKHQWHVVCGIKLLRERGFDVRLTMTGGGSGGAASLAQRWLDSELVLSDPKNSFTSQLGYVRQNELPDIIAKADLFVFASSCENMPNTLLEAMAVGLPIACSDRGPMPEVLGNAGVYFDPEKPASIAKAVEQIISDQKLRVQISQRAREYANQYSWKRCARETFSFLTDVANTSKS